MKNPDMSDDAFMNSLRQLTPEVPAETKSRLLYQCGMAAAETKLRNQRRKLHVNAMLSLLIASGIGFFLGHQFSHPTQQTSETASRSIAKESPDPTPRRSFVRTQNTTTLAVAMPLNRVFELLDQTNAGDESESMELPPPIETPLSTISFLNELN